MQEKLPKLYNLHKGNFFANLGLIIVFAVFGTMISTLVVGVGIYMNRYLEYTWADQQI